MHIIPVIDMAATGINITRLRKNAGMTVRDLQEVFGFATPQAIYKWQKGAAMPTIDNLVVLAMVFRVKVHLVPHRRIIDAFSDTLRDPHEREVFYYDYSLYDWETAMNTNMGGGLPIIGFYEMRQDVYDTARRLKG